MPQYNTFTVRIWSNGNDGLHGRIKHVASQEQGDFHDLHRMVEFVLDHIHRPKRPRQLFEEKGESREEA